MSSLYSKIQEILSSAPVNIEKIISLYNIELDKKAALQDGIAGEIRKKDDGRYKISAHKKDHYYRKRFTIAHELGHFILHGHLIGDGIDDDIKYRSTEIGDFYNSAISKKEETEANKFAAGILMPETLIKKEIEGLDLTKDETIEALAKKFQVSTAAMEIRLKALT